jgi:hypothetical protein
MEQMQNARLYVALQHGFVASDLSSSNPIKIRLFQRCFLINCWILTFHEIFLKIPLVSILKVLNSRKSPNGKLQSNHPKSRMAHLRMLCFFSLTGGLFRLLGKMLVANFRDDFLFLG